MELVNKIANNVAGRPAIIISMALRKICRYKTCFEFKPLARAQITYCLLISSIKEFLTKNVSAANPLIPLKRLAKDVPQII